MRRPATKEEHAYMKQRQKENLARFPKAEQWMSKILEEQTNGKKWTRQSQWGYRLFDFWCHELGVAVEVDGPEHNKDYDTYRDNYNLERSKIIVLRVKNFDEKDAAEAIKTINNTSLWAERRKAV